jgi:hypothetical protein
MLLVRSQWVDYMWFLNRSTINGWKLLALALKGCVFVFLGAWVFLLSTVCSSPRLPDVATRHTISYNCHGSIVFITSFQYALLMFLIPGLVVAGVSGRAAAKKAEKTREPNTAPSG